MTNATSLPAHGIIKIVPFPIEFVLCDCCVVSYNATRHRTTSVILISSCQNLIDRFTNLSLSYSTHQNGGKAIFNRIIPCGRAYEGIQIQ